MKQLPVQKGINARGRHYDGQGFTIVELLIVVVVIGILATLTVVAFNGVQKRAQTSAASSAVTQAQRKINLYQVDNSAYPAQLSAVGISDSNGTTYQYTGGGTAYCVTATVGSTSVFASNTSQSPTEGGCPGHGQGGVAAITNLAQNPESTNINYWSTYGGGTGTSAVSLSIASATWSPSGSAARATALAGATSVNAEVGGTRGYSITVPASGTLTASMYVRASSARSGGYLRMRFSSGPDVTSSPTAIGTTPVRLSVTASGVTPGLTASVVYKESGPTAFNSGDYVEASQLMVTDGSTVYTFADGNSPSWVWNGTPNASTSTGPPL